MILQDYAMELLEVPKRFKRNIIDLSELYFSSKIQKEILFLDERYEKEEALFDINLTGLTIKYTFQKRLRKTISLARIDFRGSHTNPNYDPNWKYNKFLANLMSKYAKYRFNKQSHIHIYIQDFDDKWAFPINEFNIVEKERLEENLIEFLKRFNFKLPDIQRGIKNEY